MTLTIAVVGGGRIGALRARILGRLGHRTLMIDPLRAPTAVAPVFRDVRDVCPSPDVWIVATPTAAHVAALAAILERDPGAAVLVEKPACPPGQLSTLRELLARHPRAAVEVASQYQDSSAVHTLARAAGPDADLVISFVKDRRPDEARGRFRDPVAGVLGYEWPHLHAIARTLGIPRADLLTFDSDRSRFRFVEEGDYLVEARFDTICRDGRRLVLHSGITGDSSRLHAVVGADPSNYRLVRAVGASNVQHSLWLTPSRASDAAPPSAGECLLVTEAPTGRRRVTKMLDDPLRTSMEQSIRRLVSGAPRDVEGDLDVIAHTEMLLGLRTRAGAREVSHAAP